MSKSRALFFILATIFLLAGCTSTEEGSGVEPTAVTEDTPASSDVETAVSPTTTNTPIGATYHVAPTGNDGNDGSETSPWQTVQHAVDSVQPGDLILVHAGTYAGARIEGSGTAVAPIILRANDDEAVLINQPGPNNAHDSNLELETWEDGASVAHWI
ncbi:MAG: DUF1565 domain-containing protein, partial [Chloroflexi bacterium]|nr:DUF1565 domain-containing protein [Chloroflexota bacterium]